MFSEEISKPLGRAQSGLENETHSETLAQKCKALVRMVTFSNLRNTSTDPSKTTGKAACQLQSSPPIHHNGRGSKYVSLAKNTFPLFGFGPRVCTHDHATALLLDEMGGIA